MKRLIKRFLPLIDIMVSPFIFLSAVLLCNVRKCIIQFSGRRMPLSRKIFLKVGMFPIIDHYYEPLFNTKYLKKSLREDRALPGIDFNLEEQLDILSRFHFNDELIKFPLEKRKDTEFYYNNESFKSGDAEYLYNAVRLFQSKKIVEIGSGISTLMTINAIKQNKLENSSYGCEHICIEPYGPNWLENTNAKIIRNKCEDVDKQIFIELNQNDILFIDSSHIIRPQGDVLFEYLEILPILKPGVLVHIHDIFTPKDYLDEWVGVMFWNEQYLLEAFLTFNDKYKIIGALNHLKHNYFNELSNKCPILRNEPGREPGSFWIMRK
ncbi:class I SAM-dependent methyltransferase [Candidatus Bathyarchaeota archaeon]|nr:class I SAM-dependent methyltransferase [Candidatus Bathyarchaeota archaeon]